MKSLVEGSHASCFNFNGCNKLEQNNLNSIITIKIYSDIYIITINVIFEFNSSNSSSAKTNWREGTNLNIVRYQKKKKNQSS